MSIHSRFTAFRAERKPGVAQRLQVHLRNARIRHRLLTRPRERLNARGEPDQSVETLPPRAVSDLEQLDDAQRCVPAVIRRTVFVLDIHGVDAVVVRLPDRVGIEQRVLVEAPGIADHGDEGGVVVCCFIEFEPERSAELAR
jgi:hypothetical protein